MLNFGVGVGVGVGIGHGMDMSIEPTNSGVLYSPCACFLRNLAATIRVAMKCANNSKIDAAITAFDPPQGRQLGASARMLACCNDQLPVASVSLPARPGVEMVNLCTIAPAPSIAMRAWPRQ